LFSVAVLLAALVQNCARVLAALLLLPFAIQYVRARMAELADALGSGPSSRKGVEVRVLFRAPN
jgi:hypothetical protein